MLSILGLNILWFKHDKWFKLKSFLSLVVVGGAMAILVIMLHEKYRDKLLIGHEVYVKGVVTKIYFKRSKNQVTHYAVFNYRVNGKALTHRVINTENLLTVGDTIKLVCSKLDPEVFERLPNDPPQVQNLISR